MVLVVTMTVGVAATVVSAMAVAMADCCFGVALHHCFVLVLHFV